MTDIAFDGTYITFKTPAELVPGNALIALRDDEDKILWSWHIWVTDQNPEGLAVEYEDGSLVMDRNLGALTNDVDDVRSFGLFYQWGRKDPFVGCGNVETLSFATTAPSGVKKYVKKGSDTDLLSYTVSHPQNIVEGSEWNKDYTLWGRDKTMYDPCPAGWRVSEFTTLQMRKEFSYSLSGYTDGVNTLSSVGETYRLWTIKPNGMEYYIGASIGHNNWTTDKANVYNEQNVRCVKDAVFRLVNSEVTSATPYSVNVASEVTVSDGTSIEKRGFLISETTSVEMATDGIRNIEVGSGKGQFSTTIDELLPNKMYYVISYAVGGHNVKYGDILNFFTDTSGSGEGFKPGDDYDWN